MSPLFFTTPDDVSEWDLKSAKIGLDTRILMENAGRAAFDVLSKSFDYLRGKRVLLFMGSGNNGGDAVCLARYLMDSGAVPTVVHTRPIKKYKGATRFHTRLAQACGVPFISVKNWQKSITWRPDIIVDGLLGTGFHGALRELEQSLIEQINAFRGQSFIFSIDIPSGLNGLTGRPSPIAVCADATVTFEAAKIGLVLPDAAPFIGKLSVRQIGIPQCVKSEHPASFLGIDSEYIKLLPHPSSMYHKGRAGHVLVVGGSKQYIGAPRLSAISALRTGAGLATISAPESIISDICCGEPNIMRLPLTGSGWNRSQADSVLNYAQKCKVLVLGNGIGREKDTTDFVVALLASPNRPSCIVDADAFFHLKQANAFSLLKGNDILTPHPAEAAYLLGSDVASVQDNRIAALKTLTQLSPSVWVLKGVGTMVGQDGKTPRILPRNIPTLAVGGSGDVLAGCIGAIVAQGVQSIDAASVGVLLHAEAGSILSQKYPARGCLASEIADSLPLAYSQLYKGYE